MAPYLPARPPSDQPSIGTYGHLLATIVASKPATLSLAGTVIIFSTLRAKTIGVLIVTFAGLLAAVYVVSRIVLLDGFDTLEKDNAKLNVQRVSNALSDELAGLDAELSNWVKIIDVSNVESEPDAEFSRLLTEAFTNLEVNFTIVLDLSGRIIFSKAIDIQSGQDLTFPPSFQEHFAVRDLLLRHSSPDSSTTGFVSFPEGPMFVASRPIPDSASDNPVGGTMLFARLLDDAQTATLAQSTQLSIEIRQVSDIGMPSDFQEALSALGGQDPIFIRRLKEDEVSAYTLLEDVYGDPAIVIRANMPSTIYRQGLSTLDYLVVAVALVGLFFGLVTIVGLERFVLSRVTAVRSGVDRIRRTRDTGRRLSVPGKDELSGLAQDVNAMLDELEAAEEQVQAQNRTLRRSNIRLAEAQESERRSIARDLHDELGQDLSGLKYRLEAMDKSDLNTRRVAGEEIKLVEQLIEKVRNLSSSLRPSMLDDLGLLPTLNWLVRRLQDQRDIRVEFEHSGLDGELKPNEMTAAYRIVQEGLTNVSRHADAGTIHLTVTVDDDSMRILIEDDGIGFNPETVFAEMSTVGLRTMRERVEQLDGRLSVDSAPGQGTRLRAEWPLNSPGDTQE